MRATQPGKSGVKRGGRSVAVKENSICEGFAMSQGVCALVPLDTSFHLDRVSSVLAASSNLTCICSPP